MLRTILIGLDGTADNEPAQALGLRWAKELDALADGLTVVDDPGMIAASAALLFDVFPSGVGAEPMPRRLRARSEETRDAFAKRCEASGVRCRVREDVGVPHERIVEEAEGADLVVLGRPTHFELGSKGGGGDRTLVKVLGACPRPVVTVPTSPADREATIVAFDGSLPSARAATSFAGSGLGRSGPVHVVLVGDDEARAIRRVARTVEFLRAHGLDARPAAVASASAPGDAILDQVGRLGAGMLVMGVHSRSPIRDLFVGSTTRRMLAACPVPVFFHP